MRRRPLDDGAEEPAAGPPPPKRPCVRHLDAAASFPALAHDPPRHVAHNPSGAKVVFCWEQPASYCNGFAVAIHGAPGSSYDWRYLGPALTSRGIPLLRLNLPGHGGTDAAVTKSLNPRGMAAAAVQMLTMAAKGAVPGCAGFPAGGMVLISHSLGSEVAVHIAEALLRSPPADLPPLLGLVLLNPAGLRPHRSMRPYVITQLAARLVGLPWPLGGLYRKFLRRLYVSWYGFPASVTVDEVAWAQRRAGARQFAHFAEAATVVRTRGTPSVVLCTKNDPLVEPEVPIELAEALGSEEVLVYERGGHYLNKMQAHRIAEVVRQLLPGPN